MNEDIFLLINGLAGKWHWLDVTGIFFAEKLLYVFTFLVLIVWLDKRVRRNVYLALGTAVVGRLIVVQAIKKIINHPRPYEVVQGINQILADNERGMSFPSGHTVIYFSFAFAFYGTKYFWPFVILATVGSLARVFVGVHFPLDIFTSVIIAALLVSIFRRLFKKQFSS